jgi:hypothetical protein
VPLTPRDHFLLAANGRRSAVGENDNLIQIASEAQGGRTKAVMNGATWV